VQARNRQGFVLQRLFDERCLRKQCVEKHAGGGADPEGAVRLESSSSPGSGAPYGSGVTQGVVGRAAGPNRDPGARHSTDAVRTGQTSRQVHCASCSQKFTAPA
jgi:hypothetical protein